MATTVKKKDNFSVRKFNLAGKEIGTIEVDEGIANAEANGQMVKDYIVALRANARQWSASTKTRAEVAHTTKKPHPQKGTGRARAGTLVAPQHRGGGRAHGPRPKFDQNIRINKKEKRAAIRALIGEKIRDNKLSVVDTIALDAPKTKTVAAFLNTAGFGGRVLFLGEAHAEKPKKTKSKKTETAVAAAPHEQFQKSLRNIPNTRFLLATNVSGYDLLVARELVVTEAALNEITKWLS